MRSVNIPELKKPISLYLNEVGAGEAIVIRDRDLAIATIVPLTHSPHQDDELKALAHREKRRLGEGVIVDSFW